MARKEGEDQTFPQSSTDISKNWVAPQISSIYQVENFRSRRSLLLLHRDLHFRGPRTGDFGFTSLL